MFITFKNTGRRNSQGMEHVASKSAVPRGASTTNRARAAPVNRQPCLACHSKKLHCTGRLRDCDRCISRSQACIFPNRRGGDNGSHPRPRNARSPSIGTTQSSSLSASLSPESGTADQTNLLANEADQFGHGVQVREGLAEDEPEDMQNAMHMIQDDASYQNTAAMIAAAVGHSIYAPDPTNMAAFNVQLTPPQSTFAEQHRPASLLEDSSASQSDLSSHAGQETARKQIGALPCSCIHDAVGVIQQLDDDEFRITTLSLDQVLWLQKRILAQCDKPLRCDTCNNLPTVHSVLIIICDRLTEMFECVHKRLKRVNVLISQYADTGSSSRASSTHASSDQSSGQLFCSTTGQKADKAPCNLELFQSGPQSSFSSEEQLHMIEALLRLQIDTFKAFLARVWSSGSPVSNLARQSKLNSLMTRLGTAAHNITEEIQRTKRPSPAS